MKIQLLIDIVLVPVPILWNAEVTSMFLLICLHECADVLCIFTLNFLLKMLYIYLYIYIVALHLSDFANRSYPCHC